MTFLPTPFTVQHEAYISGGIDDYGDPVDTWADPVDVPVYGWAPAGSGTAGAEPFVVGRDAVTWDLDLYAPEAFNPGPHDRITVLGEVFDIDGGVNDFNHGPFGFRPGGRIALKRSEG